LFAQTYFTNDEIAELHNRVTEARRLGADRLRIRQVVNEFANEILDQNRKLEINSKRSELIKEFNSKEALA
jgi:hypothetical protein